MDFTELAAEVYTITNRPDLVNQTETGIKAATLKAHTFDGNFFSKDIHETGIEFPESQFRQSWDYIGVIPNFREISYIRRVEDENDDDGTFLRVITPAEILDSYGVQKTDIAYVAGRVIEIRACVDFKFALVGAYVFPIITPGNYSSWVALEYPYAIVHEAARLVYRSIGQLDESNAQTQLVAEQYAIIAKSAITDGEPNS